VAALFVVADGFWGIGTNNDFQILLLTAGISAPIFVFREKRQRLLLDSGLTAAAILAMVLVGEAVLRWELAEQAVPRDQTGFDRRIRAKWLVPLEKVPTPGTFRILGLCDSFGLAGGPGNYHYQIEQLLRLKGISVEVVNFSVSGYDPCHELEVLRRFGAEYHPDLVLQGFFVGNDFFLSEGVDLVEALGLPLNLFHGICAVRPKFFLAFQWVRSQATVVWDRHLKSLEVKEGLESGTFSRKEYFRVEWQRMTACRKEAPRTLDWSRVLACLESAQEAASQMGAKYALVIHPDQYQVESALRDQILSEQRASAEEFDFSLPQRFILERTSKRGTPCLDLLPSFLEQGGQGGLYTLCDSHWNDEGNRLAAREILDFLWREGLVPSPPDERIPQSSYAPESEGKP
jgi:hypothetical protein